jgi:hypothetical protein
MRTGILFVSFRYLLPDNLPEGQFARRRITPEDTRRRIDRARAENRLRGVAKHNLFDPYYGSELHDHDVVCTVLEEHFGIVLDLEDFLNTGDADADCVYAVNRLDQVRLRPEDQLLVVNWRSASEEESLPATSMVEIDPQTVVFHLLEHADERFYRVRYMSMTAN